MLRTGRMTVAQSEALDQHWLNHGLEMQDGEIDCNQVFDQAAPLTVEIGFGMVRL